MQIISGSSCSRYYFDSGYKMISEDDSNIVEVFYAKTKDLNSRYPDFKNYITKEEQLRAERFHFEEDMETYISCHALLRLVLSKTLNKEPLEVRFFNELYNKPALLGNPLYFNISHTKGAFAFVVSNNHYVGIDLEKVSKIIDFTSIIETYFSSCEREYILESKAEALDRFFLLWTRKEALLKALGTGIIDNLKQVEVLENIIRREVFDNLIADCLFDDHFIYSTNLSNHFLSVAIPQRGKVLLYQINNEIINLYINQ